MPRVSKELNDKIIQFFKEGKSQREIARITPVTRRTIRRIGINNGFIKIESTEKYEKAYKMWLDGVSLTKIEKELNINHSDISLYIKQNGGKIKNSSIKYSYNEDVFKKIDNEIKAYWLGFITADGCITEQKRNGKIKSLVLEIGLAIRDLNHLEKFCDFIGVNKGKIRVKETYLKATNKTYKSCNIEIYNTNICRDLIKLGVKPRKTEIVEFCEYVPNDLIIHYLRGYVDGDGYFRKKITGTYELNLLGTLPFINSVVERFNIKKFNAKAKTETTKVYTFTANSLDSKRLIGEMYSNSKIYLDRKYNKAIAVLGRNI